MKLRLVLLLLLCVVPRALADGLPDLGDVSQAGFSPLEERRLGESIMREIRTDPTYDDEPEATDYINALGSRLASSSTDAHRDFSFFLIRDSQINAFALPGGFIGVNTGLVLAAQSESELAAVVAHEISHVAQHHIARMIAHEKQSTVTSLASLAAAILLSRVSSEASQAAIAFGQAGAIQGQLDFTRENEREADRTGLQILEAAGFDPHAMVTFFERLQRATRVYESGAPSYLRTHPLTYERIADMQNRTQEMGYRQVPDSLGFQLIRAKLKSQQDTPHEAIVFFQQSLAERKFLSEAASRYGLALSYLRADDYVAAQGEFGKLRKLVPSSPIVETLACNLARASGPDAALDCYREALRRYPTYRALVFNCANALLGAGKAGDALLLVEGRLREGARDHRLYELQARAYAALGKRLAQHRAQAEAYATQGNVRAAMEQLQIGLKSGDGDFFQLSSAEARLRELRKLDVEMRREAKGR